MLRSRRYLGMVFSREVMGDSTGLNVVDEAGEVFAGTPDLMTEAPGDR
jgi:hypothetical protein